MDAMNFMGGIVTCLFALALFFSLRGCVKGQLNDVKEGCYGYDGYIVEGSPARYRSVGLCDDCKAGL